MKRKMEYHLFLKICHIAFFRRNMLQYMPNWVKLLHLAIQTVSYKTTGNFNNKQGKISNLEVK